MSIAEESQKTNSDMLDNTSHDILKCFLGMVYVKNSVVLARTDNAATCLPSHNRLNEVPSKGGILYYKKGEREGKEKENLS